MKREEEKERVGYEKPEKRRKAKNEDQERRK